MKNKLIIIGGYCATGKSTFARKLSSQLGLPCFIKDNIKEVIGEGFGAANLDVHKKNSAVTFSLMLHIVETFLQSQNICIIESNLKKNESLHIEKLLKKYSSDCLTFIFTGDLDIVYDRYMERDKSGERHWVHSAAGEEREPFKEGQIQAGLADVVLGRTIVVDTTIFDDVDYTKLSDIASDFLRSI